MTLFRLFVTFMQIGLFSIGGGYAALPLIQSLVVEQNGWLQIREFSDLIAIAEMTPGPMAVNSATFVGIRLAGIPGAFAATFGCILPSCFIVSLLFYIYSRYREMSVMKSVLASLRPVVVALIASAFLTILISAVFAGGVISAATVEITMLCLFIAAFFVIHKLKWPAIPVMIMCGALYVVISMI